MAKPAILWNEILFHNIMIGSHQLVQNDNLDTSPEVLSTGKLKFRWNLLLSFPIAYQMCFWYFALLWQESCQYGPILRCSISGNHLFFFCHITTRDHKCVHLAEIHFFRVLHRFWVTPCMNTIHIAAKLQFLD